MHYKSGKMANNNKDEWKTLLTTVNNKKITLKGRHLEVFSFYQFELTYFVQVKLAIMIKKSRYGNELKVLTEERESSFCLTMRKSTPHLQVVDNRKAS